MQFHFSFYIWGKSFSNPSFSLVQRVNRRNNRISKPLKICTVISGSSDRDLALWRHQNSSKEIWPETLMPVNILNWKPCVKISKQMVIRPFKFALTIKLTTRISQCFRSNSTLPQMEYGVCNEHIAFTYFYLRLKHLTKKVYFADEHQVYKCVFIWSVKVIYVL